ncbi:MULTISPECIES: hypothetical protein [Clostridium]|uniref:hypothetical protein n=1 Tax=Clostridium TaxID=1485 RepID=UPI0005C18EE7|nr:MULTISPECIES: hypothetical protein [Clostridium]KIU07496.1 hypothetical protein SC08_Contig83orf01389 [Clostridium butyricum]MBA8967330.1 hypothetical protein [Clostridium butyricum]MBA8971604.1 hypothetical protein [Clostridium butyricum]MBC2429067.1 hypothetical protein [Clostridium butyricum]MDU1071671.1 hypothetical protein [Clostridium sp.]
MIPIDKRLNFEECKEYVKQVKQCMDSATWDYLKESISSINDDIKAKDSYLYRDLENDYYKWKKEYKDDYIVYSWITMNYSLLEKIKKFFDNTYIGQVVTNCKKLEKYDLNEVKSYSALLRRRKYPYDKNPNKIGIRNILDNKYDYDEIYEKFIECIKLYEKFSGKKINLWIIEKTNVKVCPYCNLAYTYNRGDSVTAQLDHFFSKSEYPMFALCYYNLIPSCPSCNHIKLDNNDEMTSPYVERAFKDMKVYWELSYNKDELMKKKLEELSNNINIYISSPKSGDKKIFLL